MKKNQKQSRHRQPRSWGKTPNLHPICDLHQQGLRDVPALVDWVRDHGNADTPRLAAEATKYADFFSLVSELRTAGFNADFAARQIVDDCWRLKIDLIFKQHVVEQIIEAVYAFSDSLSRKAR